MAANNLRVIYQNIADTATITASSTAGGTSTSSLKKDAKSLIWRATGTTATLTVAFGGTKTLRGIILPFTNLTSTATITATVVGGSGYSTGEVLACPYQQTDSWDSSYLPVGANSYSYGGGTYARVWFPAPETCTGVTIIITNTSNPAGYIEASRLVLGDYWSPTFNTSFGISSSPKDLSTNERTDSGDLVTTRGVRYNSMRFDLTWLDPTDRAIFTKILKTNGISKPLLISLFPDASEDYNKEQTYQIYGKLSQLSDISHPMFGIYSSSIDIEEI